MFDMSGNQRYYELWKHYYKDTTAIMFVLDAADPSRFGEADAVLQDLLRAEQLKRVPLLFLCNKTDLATAATPAEIALALHLPATSSRAFQLQATSALTGQGVREGMQWLLGQHCLKELRAVGSWEGSAGLQARAGSWGYGFGGVNGADAVEAGRLGGEKAVELGICFGGVNGASPSEAAEKAKELGYGFGGVNGASPSEACRRSNKAQGKASEGESAGVCALSGLTGKKGKLLCPNSGQHGPWLRWGNGGLALCSTCYKRNHCREARGHPELLDPGLKPRRR
ncbi:hypothetical protein HYH03_018786 [Edaphochlamys debaryana]|uniref:Uncharacterized protein n=1 Tax=Edaphochlamys debaryana TaxID=47281 RepID=A0A835XFV9_9CHLO|nr:hypothetical protein HYH03_018786 [Edaphochlamys debaryana]|eukprot:KAG2482272.1 hypothetical protein HYH03_018786 [Edaphochlamys debaryana]